MTRHRVEVVSNESGGHADKLPTRRREKRCAGRDTNARRGELHHCVPLVLYGHPEIDAVRKVPAVAVLGERIGERFLASAINPPRVADLIDGLRAGEHVVQDRLQHP